MSNTLVLCGGTGAHVGLAFVRLHTLGHALGFFGAGGSSSDFPALCLVDQDAGDGTRDATAWQTVRRLLEAHPSRGAWKLVAGSDEPEIAVVTPLPVGSNQAWAAPPHDTLATRFPGSRLLPALASERQRRIEFSKGMLASPSLGALLVRLKELDERQPSINHDPGFDHLLQRRGALVVAGSGIGGTGASVGPTLALHLARQTSNRVMAVMVLRWFRLVEEGSTRGGAQRRNRQMEENANCALAFYGHTLAHAVAAVPVGAPDSALVPRTFTGDNGQAAQESFLHAVAALCAFRHYAAPAPPGLYALGAVDRQRLDGGTAVAGGTLQDLANQAACVAGLLDTWRQVLLQNSVSARVRPALYNAVVAGGLDPGALAEQLGVLGRHYAEQVAWLRDCLGIDTTARLSLTLERDSRTRLADPRHVLRWPSDRDPRAAAAAVFRWAADWVKERSTTDNGLRSATGQVGGGHWPELRTLDGVNIAPDSCGVLKAVDGAVRGPVLEAFVDRERLTANGWPHPLGPVDFFRHAIEQAHPRALRQLELLLAGLSAGTLSLAPLAPAVGPEDEPLALESLVARYRRAGPLDAFPGLAEQGVFYSGQLIAFNAPHTLLCPVPHEDGEPSPWQELWTRLTGATDQAPWDTAQAPPRWSADAAVRRVRAWVRSLERIQGVDQPPWARVFENYESSSRADDFEAGPTLRAFWSPANAPARRLVELQLPVEPGESVYDVPAGTPSLDEVELRQLVPELQELREGDVVAFSEVLFRKPGDATLWHGFWLDHLLALKRLRKVHLAQETAGGAVVVGVVREGQLHTTVLARSVVLKRDLIGIRQCVPLQQDPLPGSRVPPGSRRYPDLPLRSDFIDLVCTREGARLLEVARGTQRVPADGWQPEETHDNQGRLVLRWKLRLLGRAEPMIFELRLSAEDAQAERAHWLVWPRFRSVRADPWRAYYVYHHATHAGLVCDVLWLDAQDEGPHSPLHRRRARDGEWGAFPVSFDNRPRPHHDGGPPLALCARNFRTQAELGLYVLSLDPVGPAPLQLGVAIDFGTSHSVAAVGEEREGGGQWQTRPVALAAEIGQATGLTLHVCENRVHALEDDDGVLAASGWLPTYCEPAPGEAAPAVRRAGALPSELCLRQPIRDAAVDDPLRWEPGRDYMIPRFDLARPGLAPFLLTDFKWVAGSREFRGRETQLQRHYLALFGELILADIVAGDARVPALPETVRMTFTYPLRASETAVRSWQGVFGEVVESLRQSTGIAVRFHGIYDESRAAGVKTRRVGEVTLVADLGGGTLDVFVEGAHAGDHPVHQVADSARLGGNLLLRTIAERAQTYLPPDGNWIHGDPKETESRLRAWIRSSPGAAARLFGLRDGGGDFPRLGVRGFSHSADADATRRLIERYFRLLGEFLARTLAAYLSQHWLPGVPAADREQLQIALQLRGNGWRLRYHEEDDSATTRRVANLVRERLRRLWPLVHTDGWPDPSEERYWLSATEAGDDPKGAPCRRAVGEAMPYEQVKQNWHTHALVDIDAWTPTQGRVQVPWYSSVPFPTGSSKRVQVSRLEPPLPLAPEHEARAPLDTLAPSDLGAINQYLQELGVVDPATGAYRAPVGPLVWESIFGSQHFWDEGRP